MEGLPYTNVDGEEAMYPRNSFFTEDSAPHSPYSALTSPLVGCIFADSIDAGWMSDSTSPKFTNTSTPALPPVLDLNKGSTCASKRRFKKRGRLSRKKGKARKTTKTVGKA